MLDRHPDLELVVLGAGPAYTDRAGAAGAAYLIRAGDASILLDLGHGSFARLAAEMEPSRLHGIAISHLHPDHFIDLVPLRHYLRWEWAPSRRVRVLGPSGLDARIDALHAETGFTAEALDVEAISDGVTQVGPFTLEARLVAHTAESYGFRVSVDGGPGLVYSGDCGRAEDLDPLIRAGDTVLVEVFFGTGPVFPGARHLDAPAVAALARRTDPGAILLTHIGMGRDRDATLEMVSHATKARVAVVDPGYRMRIS